MKNMRLFAGLCVATLAGCAGIKFEPDAMCGEIARFANAVAVGEVKSVRLRMAWGSGLDGKAETLFENECEYAGFAPGAALCQYLIEHTSVEFNSINIDRAVSCLTGTPQLQHSSKIRIQELQGRISSWLATGTRPDIQVTVNFATGDGKDQPFLEISAEPFVQ